MKKGLGLFVLLALIFSIFVPNNIKAEGTIKSGYFEFEGLESDTLTFDLFDPLELKVVPVEGKEELSDVHYTWNLCSSSINPKEIEKARDKNELYIPSYNFITNEKDNSGIECRVDFKIGENEYYDVVLVDLDVDQSIYFENCGKVVFVDAYTIRQGQSFDLAHPNDAHGDPAIGSGTISLSADGNEITLNDVKYSYDPEKSIADDIFCLNNGFAFYSFMNDLNDVNINFVGENVINNNYHIEGNDTDGTTFLMSITTDGSDACIDVPTYHLKGSGSLETNGGYYGVLGHGIVDVDAKLVINGTKDEKYPGRFGIGLAGANVIFNNNADVSIDEAGCGVAADIIKMSGYGKIELKEGSKVNIVVSNYVRHPYKYQLSPSMSAGINSTNDIKISGSSLNIKLVADFDICADYKKVNTPESIDPDSNIDPYSLKGIGNYSNSFDPYFLNINNSDVNIEFELKGNPGVDNEIVRVKGVEFENTLCLNENSYVKINNSKVKINIPDDNSKINSAYGISSYGFEIKDSNVDLNVNAYSNSRGIIATRPSYVKYANPYELVVKSSDVNIKTNGVGVLCDNMFFDYDDSLKKFVVNADNYAVLADLKEEGPKKDFDDSYVPSKISLFTETVENDDKDINICSISSIDDNAVLGNDEVKNNITRLKNLVNNDPKSELSILDPFAFELKTGASEDEVASFEFIKALRSSVVFSPVEQVNMILSQVDKNDQTLLENENYKYYETFYNVDQETVANELTIVNGSVMISDILPDDFPNVQEDAWVNGNGGIVYKNDDKLSFNNETSIDIPLDSYLKLNEDGNYELPCDGLYLTFNMKDGVLDSITLVDEVRTAYEGTYADLLEYFAIEYPSPTKTGHLPYYQCKDSGKYYEDQACTKEIMDLNSWLLGDGYISSLDSGNEKYIISEGDKALIELNKVSDFSFKSSADFGKFICVMVDGSAVNTKYYVAKSGSTIITFNEAYLKALADGVHTLVIVSKDGHAKTSFTIRTLRPVPGTYAR